MENPLMAQESQLKMVQAILDAAKKAFDPSADATSREHGVREYDEVVKRTQTWILLHALNALIKPNVLPPWLREPLMHTLTRLPLRPDGVRATMEFVFAVHPSNSGQPGDTSSREKEGAAITHEAVAVAAKLLSSVPSSMTPQLWFSAISSQLFKLFDGEAGPDVAKTAAQIVGFGILGKRQLGAPGAPGWNAFVQPMLEAVNPSLATTQKDVSMQKEDDAFEILELGRGRVLVAAHDLGQSLRRLELMIMSNPSPGLCKRVLKPALLQIWALASWANPPRETEQLFCKSARSLVQTYLRLFRGVNGVMPLIRNLLCKGSLDDAKTSWRYRLVAESGIEIVKLQNPERNQEAELVWSDIESKSATLVVFMTAMCSTEEVSSVFLYLLQSWIQMAGTQSGSSIKITSHDGGSESAIHHLINVTLLQKLMDKAPEKLVSHFNQLLELVCQVLHADKRSPLGDDIVGIVLSLLNLVITAPTFQKSDINPYEFKIVQESLDRIGYEDRGDTSATARNLLMLLKYRDDMKSQGQKTSAPTARQIEDRRTYSLAMNYITGGGHNPPPVLSEGLNLLSGLILAESSILDIPAVTVLMSNLLKENEDFINLRVIKIFTQIASKHPKSTMQELLDHYLDAQERLSVDVRLRFGEAILQVVERLGETFVGEAAQHVGETLLSIAGRRGYRPKRMAEQTREERLAALKKAKRDAGGEERDIETAGEESLEQVTNDILGQIVRGWERNRGSEDVRMRTSALSIFGIAIETSVIGLGPTLVSAAVDLSINVIAMEPEPEKAILRRAAILAILSFVRALDKAKESGRTLGFGLTDKSREDIRRTLSYVAGTDNDGLVQQHARDVVESLEHWGMASLLPGQGEGGATGFTVLAGLRLTPGGGLIADGYGRPRPRIEEVE